MICTPTVRSFCEETIKQGMSFIFTCKKDSHPWLYETLKNSYMCEVKESKWDARKKKRVQYTWKYLNDIPIRYDEREPFLVNYISLEIRAEGTVKPSYRNSWITNKAISEMNVRYISECGRARWKIENEHNNVLKNRGYNLEHNLSVSEILCKCPNIIRENPSL